VAKRAAEYAREFDAQDEAALAGLLHDLGKYGDLFQARLEGRERDVDHWSLGAWVALERYKDKGIAAALAIQGHHLGLQCAAKDDLEALDPRRLVSDHPLGLRLSAEDAVSVLERLRGDGIVLPEEEAVKDSVYDWDDAKRVATMLDVRMLFSALVDADFIETEAHFNRDREGRKLYRERGPDLDARGALSALLAHVRTIANQSSASSEVNSLRAELLRACLNAATHPPGLFTLTAPTGSGKTLSMLAFALKHALTHQLRRIVVVIPYLSIIEQTARTYREVFEPLVGKSQVEHFVLEHHSLAGTRTDDDTHLADRDGQEPECSRARLLAENWDAPIIVTTSVQMLESLFANRPSACRKLHRLARSVILFDEVQTLPISLAVPTLAALSRLSERYGASVVFSTATQPAFAHLDQHVRQYCALGWVPKEIVPDNLGLFRRARRTITRWPESLDARVSWSELAERLASHKQALCVVNLKRHALSLFDVLAEQRGEEEVFHLSTSMCPAHRGVVLSDIRQRLEGGLPCLLVSTQCVEAGVDLDFPIVYRAFGPLDAVTQAAGRCNRNGKAALGEVHVFLPEAAADDSLYPDGAYRQAADVLSLLLAEHRSGALDIHDPRLCEKYYRQLYSFARPEAQSKQLLYHIKRQDFKAVAQHYRLIERDALDVLVPYEVEVFETLRREVRMTGLTGGWIRRARPYTVGLYRRADALPFALEPVPLGKEVNSQQWYIYLRPEHYDRRRGLVLPTDSECLIA